LLHSVISKLAAYVVLEISEGGHKEVLSIIVGENESGKYWLSILNSLKNRGV
jgi:putative transposase